MMGHTHALSGAAAWLALAPILSEHGMRMTPAQVAAGAIVCAGSALLPDLDHHDGTIANTYGPFTQVLCRGVAAVSGGHRHATHSFAFAIGAMFGANWLAEHAVKVWWGMLFLLVGLGLRGVGVRIAKSDHFSALFNAAIAAGVTLLLARLHFGGPGISYGWSGHYLEWAGLAVGIGCTMHILGDCLTPEGCPLFWPVQTHLEIPIVPRTDGRAEKWVVAPILTLAIIVLTFRTTAGTFATHWLQRPH